MSNVKQTQAEIQKRGTELRKLRNEERVLLKVLKEANGQLTQLQVEALEIRSRTRNFAHNTAGPKPGANRHDDNS